ncbi:MAG TPA: peroxiredoxin [Polyangiaceae bacterium]|jgi:peroxiredoxin Q/BCP
MLQAGDRAPDFTLPAADGRSVSLADFHGKKVVVLFFYPKDETPGCTREACEFRDSYEQFGEAGAEVIGVSDDDVQSHQKFAAHHRLPMLLLSDVGGKVREKFGVKALLGILPDRVTFVIDKDGTIRHTFAARLRFGKHVEEALHVVGTLARSGAAASPA